MARSSTLAGKPRKPVAKAAARRGAAPRADAGNGMHSFAVHTELPTAKVARGVLAARPAARGARAAGAAPAAPANAAMDPESAAAEYLQRALKSAQMPDFTDPQGSSGASEFLRLGTENMPLTDSRIVKYRQTVNKIPIYGSLVTVELDHDNNCLAINSSLGAPKGLSAVAKVAPQAALELAAAQSGNKAAELKATPRLNYYFDKMKQAWALAYIVENVPKRSRSPQAMGHAQAALFDYVIDALSGKLIAALPRTASAALVERVLDGPGVERSLPVDRHLRLPLCRPAGPGRAAARHGGQAHAAQGLAASGGERTRQRRARRPIPARRGAAQRDRQRRQHDGVDGRLRGGRGKRDPARMAQRLLGPGGPADGLRPARARRRAAAVFDRGHARHRRP
jgi:Fungalysin/Thermolysin Propeptide Motif